MSTTQKEKDKNMISDLLKTSVKQPTPVQSSVTINKVKETKEEERQLNFWVPKSFKKHVDQFCAANDTTIKEFVQVAIKEYWKKHNYKAE